MLAIAARFARTATRYDERAERYVQMEAGHASQNVYLQSAALELATCVVGAFDDAAVQNLLGLVDEVDPLALMPVGKPSGTKAGE